MAPNTPTESTDASSYPPTGLGATRKYDHVRLAHALLYGLALLVFVFAALALRFFTFTNVVRLHYGLQLLATALMFGGFACGVWMAQQDSNRQDWHYVHEILGTIIAAAVFVPLIIGYLQHDFWKKYSRPSWRNSVHVWTARIFILLGMVDGVLPNIPATPWFGGPCAIVLLIYLFIVVRWQWKRRQKLKQEAGVSQLVDGGIEGIVELGSASDG